MSTGSFTFENNSAGTQGGAIYAESVTFSGDGTVGTFTGNVAGAGNDIYLINASSVLTFQGAGTYSFDGGIVLAAGLIPLAVFGSVALGWFPVGELLFIKIASRLFFQDKIQTMRGAIS